jgi:hypothetical protein
LEQYFEKGKREGARVGGPESKEEEVDEKHVSETDHAYKQDNGEDEVVEIDVSGGGRRSGTHTHTESKTPPISHIHTRSHTRNESVSENSEIPSLTHTNTYAHDSSNRESEGGSFTSLHDPSPTQPYDGASVSGSSHSPHTQSHTHTHSGSESENKEKETYIFTPYAHKPTLNTEFWRKTIRDIDAIAKLSKAVATRKISSGSGIQAEKKSVKEAKAAGDEPKPVQQHTRTQMRENKHEIEKINMRAGEDAGKAQTVPDSTTKAPRTLSEAKRSGFWAGYEKAIDTELTQLEKNNTWKYVDRKDIPSNSNILHSKFVFDIKRGPTGEFIKYKARLVAVGSTQIYGIDYFDTYASVMNIKSFRILLTLYNQNKEYNMQHWDVKQAFVNAPIEEEVYVEQVKGFERGGEKKYLKLNKALYGTKQAAHAWQKYLSGIFLSAGGKRNVKDECIYMFVEGDAFCIIGTHVDDLFPLYNKPGEKIKDRIYEALQSKVEIDNKGEIKHALDMHIQRNKEKGILSISQETYVQNIIEEFHLQEAKAKNTPGPTCDITEEDAPTDTEEIKKAQSYPIRNAIGKLWWLALISRPDIICALHKCAMWQNKPSLKLWQHIIWIMKYIKGTKDYALVYKREQENTCNIYAYCDASFAKEEGSKSRYAYMFFIHGCIVSWQSANTSRVCSSSTESECHAIVHAVKENIWITQFINALGIVNMNKCTIIYQDNKSAITLAEKGGKHKRSKHFTIEMDIVKECIQLGEIKIVYVPTEDMHADMLTKNLPHTLFVKHRNIMIKSINNNNVLLLGVVDEAEAT